jgi:hypothetical protein
MKKVQRRESKQKVDVGFQLHIKPPCILLQVGSDLMFFRLRELSSVNKVSLVKIMSCGNTGSIRVIIMISLRENKFELIQLSIMKFCLFNKIFRYKDWLDKNMVKHQEDENVSDRKLPGAFKKGEACHGLCMNRLGWPNVGSISL